jgi:hypothetical protein
MFEPQNSIIIVDDMEKDLSDLSKVFNASGVSCRTIQYTTEYNNPLKGVRIAFFDINITNKNYNFNQDEFDYKIDSSLSAVFNDLTIAISSCIDSETAPFALIFWSKNTTVVDNFIKYVRERVPNLPSPILVDSIDKSQFIGNPEGVKARIEQIFQDKSIKLLLDFENTCVVSASNVVDDIYKIIPKNPNVNDKTWGNSINFEVNFEKIFSKIAISSLGIQHARKNPDKAVYEALIPILNHKIVANINQSKKWESSLTSLKIVNAGNEIVVPNFQNSSLNSIFHIDINTPIDYTTRGAVFIYNYEYDFVATNRFDFFCELDKKSKEVFSRFVQFNETNIDAEERDFVRGNSKFVVIEISAICDYSQNKLRNHKFILALLTPAIKNNQINGALINESIFYKDIPILHYKGNDYRLWIGLNFSFSDIEINKRIGESLFILKKEIIDMIGNRYANHVSRIGITSF